MRKLREYHCTICGRVIWRPSRTDRPKLCPDDAVRRATDNAWRRHLASQGRKLVKARQRAATAGGS